VGAGAATSGLATPSGAGPRPEKSGSRSSASPVVPRSSVAPTVITQGSSAGLVMLPRAGPWLLAATTTAIPAAQARSTA
jgi:hypothetical protein